MTPHDTASSILRRTILDGTVATKKPEATHTYATADEPPASDRDTDADTPRQTTRTTTVNFGHPDRFL